MHRPMNRPISKTLTTIAMAAAFIGMGIAMPSCPGQQAMQQQVDTLTASNADLNKKVQALDSQLRGANGDLAQIKQLMGQMTNAIQAQKAALDQLDTSVKEMAARKAAPAPVAKKAAPKKRGR